MSLTTRTGNRLRTYLLLVPALVIFPLVAMPSLAVELVSAVQNGPTISEHPNADAREAGISADGRYILYWSGATNVIEEADLNDYTGAFVYDRQADAARVLTAGPNSTSSVARFIDNDSILFRSQGPDSIASAYLYHLATDQIEPLDHDPYSLFNDQDSVVLANDTRTVAWNAQHDDGSWHIVVADSLTGEQRRIGTGSNSAFNLIEFSGDSRFLLFDTRATNLNLGATTTETDVFLANVATGSIALLTGSLEYYANALDINFDGSLVLIHTSNQNPTPPAFRSSSPFNTAVVNVASGEVEFVENNLPDGRAQQISDDGRFITSRGAFFSAPVVFSTVYIKDRLTNTQVHVTAGHERFSGLRFASDGNNSVLSADGSTLVFASHSNTLIAPDYAATSQIFAYDISNEAIQKVSKRNNQPLAFSGDLDSYLPSITDDGRRVVFASKSLSLVPGITNVLTSDRSQEWQNDSVTDHVYLRDRSVGSTETITGSGTGEPPARIFGYSFPNISRDGRYIIFERGRGQDQDLYYDTEQERLIAEGDGLGIDLYDAAVQFDSSGTWFVYRSSDILDDRNPDELNGLFLHNYAEDSTRFISFAQESRPIIPHHASINAAGEHLVIHYRARLPAPEFGVDYVWRYYNIESATLEPLFHEDATQPEPNPDWPVELLGDTGLVLYQSESSFGEQNCYLHDRATGNTTLLAPVELGMCSQPRASNDGDRIVFKTSQPVVDPEGTARVMRGVMLLDREQDRFIAISNPEPVRSWLTSPSRVSAVISGNGEVVVFESFRENLTPDGNGRQDVFAVEVADILNADNQPPVGVTQNVHTPIDEALVVFLTARDDDADPLAYEIVRQPEHGTLSGDHPNTVYTPNPGFRGIDRFEFVVSDGIATSDPARVTIEVAETAACANGCPQLVSAVLPGSRSVTTNATATAFATVINPSTADAFDCGISLDSSPNIDFQFQATDALTNATLSAPNELVDMAPGGAQSFLLSLTPRANFDTADVQFQFSCGNMRTAQVLIGLNTLELSASESPTPDVIAVALTPTADGIAQAGRDSFGVYVVATSNVDAADLITARPFANSFFGGDALICETDTATGVCISPPASSVQSGMAEGSSHSFGVFVRSTTGIALDPAVHRHFVHFTDSTNKRRGSTSVALRTQ